MGASTQGPLDTEFTATLVTSDAKGGWTYVQMPGSAEFFGTRGLVSALIGVIVVLACLSCERVARRRGRSVREARCTLPAGVVAALIGVAITWAVHLLAFVPLL